jgi:hypothetical protein
VDKIILLIGGSEMVLSTISTLFPGAPKWFTWTCLVIGIATVAYGIYAIGRTRIWTWLLKEAARRNGITLGSAKIERDVWLSDVLTYIAFGTWEQRPEWYGDVPEGQASDVLGKLNRAVEAVRQRAFEGALPMWGREGQTGLFTRLPEEYWKHYGIDLTTLLDAEARELLRTEVKTHARLNIGVMEALMTSKAKVLELWPAASS